MDPWQAKRQIAEKLLPTIVWVDAPGAVVLTGGSLVSEDEPGDFIPREAFLADGPAGKVSPFAVIHDGPMKFDRRSQQGRIEELRIRVWVVAGGKGITDPNPTANVAAEDTHGANRVTGALRDPVQGQGKSTGRDVDEVTSRIVEALNNGQLVDSLHGMQAVVEDPNVVAPVSGVQWLARLLEIVIFNAATSRFYHPAVSFSVSKVAGQAQLNWTAPPVRYDSTLGVVRRGTSSGDPAPTSPTAGGTLVSATVPVGAVTFTDNPGAGTWNYAYWPGYAETPAAQLAQVPDRYPAAVTAGVVI